MNTLIQLLIQGLALGSMYALLALGYNLIYSTMNMAHFAQGDVMMVGAYAGMIFYVNMDIPFLPAVFLTMIVTIAVMIIIERLVYRPMYDRSAVSLLICTIGMSIVLRNGAQAIFGPSSHGFPSVLGSTAVSVGSLLIVPQNVWITVIGAALMAALGLFMNRTKMGIAMRAVSLNRTAASLMGIKMTTITLFTYGIAAALAAVAACLMAPIYKVYPTMGSTVGLKAMTASCIGGMGNLYGAMVGSLLLGLLETLFGAYVSTQYKEALSVILLLLILLLKPEGLLGQKRITKV
ncbi:MAG: branched-chain amino acid ABC transporter permease [Lachnospiraceae bacterium]|nr:branched-chain amino acid ABC transporter permease [Lachnospiraceae bacterium]